MTTLGNPAEQFNLDVPPGNSGLTVLGKYTALPVAIGVTLSSISAGLTLASGNLTFGAAAAKIIPGATSLTFRNTTDAATNLSITNAGLVTVGQGNLTLTAGNLTFGAASAKIIPGATSLLFRNNADGATNVTITDAGLVTVARGNVAITAGNLSFGAASAKIIPGATSLLFRDTADANTNVTITDAGAVTIRSTTTSTGAITPTGGVAAAGGFVARTVFHSGGSPPVATTTGTDATPVNTETYIVDVEVTANCTLTGVALLNGSVAAGNVKISLADSSTGAPIAAALTASTAMAGTAAYQRIPFAVPYAAVGPARYLILVQFDTNTTPRYRAHPVGTFGAAKKTGETYGTFTTVTVPSTFTADVAPICSTY